MFVRGLPRNPKTGEPVPDCEGVHRQLGSKTSKISGEKYPQAREFNNKGKPVRVIDFTDHGRPSNHSNPDTHFFKENPTVGSMQRGKAEKLKHWNYKK